MNTHPTLTIHLSIGDSLSDFYLDWVGVAVRYGAVEDSPFLSLQ